MNVLRLSETSKLFPPPVPYPHVEPKSLPVGKLFLIYIWIHLDINQIQILIFLLFSTFFDKDLLSWS